MMKLTVKCVANLQYESEQRWRREKRRGVDFQNFRR
jgi:hypothetical protein